MITTDFFEIKMSAFKKFSRKINAAHTLAISCFFVDDFTGNRFATLTLELPGGH